MKTDILTEAVRKIESSILAVDSLDAKKKAELLRLLDSLKIDIKSLPEAHGERAHSVAGFAELAAHEAMRSKKSPHLLRHALDGLSLSAKSFEASHPDLVKTINDICLALARIGI